MSDLESAARRAVEQHGLDASGLGVIPADPGSPFIASTPDVIVYVASDDATRSRLQLEGERLVWARTHGVPVPQVLRVATDHLIVQRLPDTGRLTGAAVSAVVVAIDLLAAAPPPPMAADGQPGGQPPRGAPPRVRRSVGPRLRATAAFARLGIWPWQVLSVRRRAHALPATVSVHGDLQPANILVDDAGAIALIDLELVGRGPAGWDLATLWPMLGDADDRGLLRQALALRTPDEEHRDRLLRWLTLRWIGDLLAARNPDAPLAVARWHEVRRSRLC